jgi:hypothetical protein
MAEFRPVLNTKITHAVMASAFPEMEFYHGWNRTRRSDRYRPDPR